MNKKLFSVKLKLFMVLCVTAITLQAMAQALPYTLTANGIGPVQIGTKAFDLPESVPQLYASMVSDVLFDGEMPDDEDMPEFATWYFYDDDGETVFTATSDSQGYITEISVTSPNILTAEGLHVGAPRRQIEALEGVQKIDANPLADYPQDVYLLNGATINLDSYYTEDGLIGQDVIASISISDPVLTPDGLGIVRLGIKADDLPDSTPRLYARRVQAGKDWHYLDEQGKELFIAKQDDDGLISEITVTAPSISTTSGVHVGMSLQQVENLSGTQMTNPMVKDTFLCYDLYDVSINVEKSPKGEAPDPSLIASMSVPGLAYDRVNDVIGQVMTFYSNSTSFHQLESHVDEIRNIDGVDSAYTDGCTTLYVDVLEFGSVSFSFFPDDLYSELVTIPHFRDEIKKIIPGSHQWVNQNLNTFTVANQLENNLNASRVKNYADVALDMFRYSGFENVTHTSPTVDFFMNGIYDNDMVFLITHGSYDKKIDVHWLVTSDIAGVYNEKTRKYIGTSIYQKYKYLCKTSFMGLSYLTEKRQQGDKKLAYIKVSDLFISSSKRKFSDCPAIVFNVACSSLQHDDTMAQTFAEKGAFYLGYDYINGVGICGGLQYFSRILSGMNAIDAFNSLDKTSKTDPVRNAKLSIHPNGTRHFFYPRMISHEFKLPKMNRVIDNKLTEEQWITFSTTYKMPLLYLEVNDARKYKVSLNENLTSIPLEYGFELCPNKDFKDSEIIRILAELNKTYNTNSDAQTEGNVSMSCNLTEGTVSFNLSFTMPLTNCPFWNPQREHFYLRPIIYNKDSGFVSYGQSQQFYHKHN